MFSISGNINVLCASFRYITGSIKEVTRWKGASLSTQGNISSTCTVSSILRNDQQGTDYKCDHQKSHRSQGRSSYPHSS